MFFISVQLCPSLKIKIKANEINMIETHVIFTLTDDFKNSPESDVSLIPKGSQHHPKHTTNDAKIRSVQLVGLEIEP